MRPAFGHRRLNELGFDSSPPSGCATGCGPTSSRTSPPTSSSAAAPLAGSPN
ncbi:hypothetical protein ACFQ60_37595 [Streptomyces zhihengii]